MNRFLPYLRFTGLLELEDEKTVFSSVESKEIIETEFLVWLSMKNAYDQIRVLDNTGQEILRANYNNGNPSIVSESDLQNKSSRYYFTDSIGLNNRDLYMSVLDLNKENGQIELINNEVKPMLRVATPFFNESGDKLGIVIVNYLVEGLFEALDALANDEHHNIEIINEDGYYVYASNEDIEFGFMYDDLINETFSKYHAYDIFSNESGVIIIDKDKEDNEYYTSIKLSSEELTGAANKTGNNLLNVVLEDKEFIIFTELVINENLTFLNMRNTYIYIGISLLFVALVITRLVDESIHLRQENIKRMKYDSLHDLLTTLPNRKSIYEQIEYQLKRKNLFTLLFIDFDGFKKVNDQFGHSIGEALIQGSKRIKDIIRFDDILARIGGDEFVVILRDLSDDGVVSRICETIIDSFNYTFDLRGNIASMGVSIGAYVCEDNTKSIDDIVSKSDEAMYQVKNSGKNNYMIFNDSVGSKK